MREIRELGQAIILIDQHPSLISVTSLGNTYCTIAMNLKHNYDVNSIGEAILLEAQRREILGKLEVGYGVVKLQGRWLKPFLVKFPLVSLNKGLITDQDVKTKMQPSMGQTDYEVIRVIPGSDADDQGVIRVFLGSDKEEKEKKREIKITQEEKSLLEDIIKNPWSSTVERYRRLKLNSYKGNKTKKRLEDKAMVEIEDIPTPTARVRLIKLTEDGKKLMEGLGFETSLSRRKGGFEHEYWKKRIAAHYLKENYQVEVEKAIGQGKSVDIVASRDGKQVAIEVETGKSDAVYNVIKDLEAGFDKVVSAAIGTDVQQDISSQLREVGIEDSKVEVQEANELIRSLGLILS